MKNNFFGYHKLNAKSLGCSQFKRDYNLSYAYVTGGMVRGIASKEMVARIGKSGMLGFFGTGTLSIEEIENAIVWIKNKISKEKSYGMNLLCDQRENQIIDLYLKHEIRVIEAAAYREITSALVKYKLKGLKKETCGTFKNLNHIFAKISRPEVAEKFLCPPPRKIVNNLLKNGEITEDQAEHSEQIPMADEICVEADSGGHTDRGIMAVIVPKIIKQRNEAIEKYKYEKKIRVGAAGGIGTPEAAAAAFILGADFILTGSINQCTIESGASDAVKDILENIDVQDTTYAPAGDLFEMGSKVQVLKKGLLFPQRANKLYDLWRQYKSIDEIDERTKNQIQKNYCNRNFPEIYLDCKKYYSAEEIEEAENNPKKKMAFIFRWYFGHATRLAALGKIEQKVNFQVHCGPALGAFNQWVKGTKYERWCQRHVDEIGLMLLDATARYINNRFESIINQVQQTQ